MSNSFKFRSRSKDLSPIISSRPFTALGPSDIPCHVTNCDEKFVRWAE